MPSSVANLESVLQLKQRIRRQHMERRAALSDRIRKEAAHAATQLFLGAVPLEITDVIAGYSPVSGELDVRLLMEILLEQGYRCALPVVQGGGKPLLFRQYKKDTLLIRNPRFNMMEPAEDTPPVVPSVILVPLVAFDAHGNRLGFGGGFYDRTLAELSRQHAVFSVGMAYAFQQIALVPSLPHDQKLDCVITDRRIVVCNQVQEDDL